MPASLNLSYSYIYYGDKIVQVALNLLYSGVGSAAGTNSSLQRYREHLVPAALNLPCATSSKDLYNYSEKKL